MPESAAATFAALGVAAPLVEILNEQGITTPFPVQAAVLPDGLAGRDILGRAQTGSGKTLSFSLPMVSRLAGGSTASRRPRGLVLVPTRELAAQVTLVLKPLARAMGLLVTTIYGGVAYGPQVSALTHRTDIIVATPGRLADLIGQRECDLSDVEVTVVDEADQMADLGFLPIVRRLLEITPDDGQRMLFSATLDSDVDVLARRFLNAPVLHSVDENSSPPEIEHHVFTVEAANRVAVLAALAGGEKRSLVFVRTKHGAERTARQLTEAGVPAAELHGNLRQGARSRNLDAFTSGLARVMVATDLAARGIHIDSIDLVIHADPPAEHKAYVHRSGRTARGGADGVVVTLQTRAQARDVTLMMGKAGITPPPAVAVDAHSGVLAEIAGPPAPRVTVAGKVSQLVQPEDRLARADRPGAGRPGSGRASTGRPGPARPGADRSRPGRPQRDGGPDRKLRDDRFSASKPGSAGPREDDRGNDGSGYGREAGRPR
ncbi:MAG TPA: DEAD/DEAH box helicase, partial [Trebonia sp.]